MQINPNISNDILPSLPIPINDIGLNSCFLMLNDITIILHYAKKLIGSINSEKEEERNIYFLTDRIVNEIEIIDDKELKEKLVIEVSDVTSEVFKDIENFDVTKYFSKSRCYEIKLRSITNRRKMIRILINFIGKDGKTTFHTIINWELLSFFAHHISFAEGAYGEKKKKINHKECDVKSFFSKKKVYVLESSTNGCDFLMERINCSNFLNECDVTLDKITLNLYSSLTDAAKAFGIDGLTFSENISNELNEILEIILAYFGIEQFKFVLGFYVADLDKSIANKIRNRFTSLQRLFYEIIIFVLENEIKYRKRENLLSEDQEGQSSLKKLATELINKQETSRVFTERWKDICSKMDIFKNYDKSQLKRNRESLKNGNKFLFNYGWKLRSYYVCMYKEYFLSYLSIRNQNTVQLARNNNQQEARNLEDSMKVLRDEFFLIEELLYIITRYLEYPNESDYNKILRKSALKDLKVAQMIFNLETLKKKIQKKKLIVKEFVEKYFPDAEEKNITRIRITYLINMMEEDLAVCDSCIEQFMSLKNNSEVIAIQEMIKKEVFLKELNVRNKLSGENCRKIVKVRNPMAEKITNREDSRDSDIQKNNKIHKKRLKKHEGSTKKNTNNSRQKNNVQLFSWIGDYYLLLLLFTIEMILIFFLLFYKRRI